MEREERKITYLRRFITAFSENGIDKTSIKKLAGAANINEASIYQYFKNKDEIIIDCVGFYFRTLTDDLRPVFLDAGQPIEYRFRKAMRYLDGTSMQEKFVIQVLTSPAYGPLCTPIVKDFLRFIDPLSERLSVELSIEPNVLASVLFEFFNIAVCDKIFNDREMLASQLESLLGVFKRERVYYRYETRGDAV